MSTPAQNIPKPRTTLLLAEDSAVIQTVVRSMLVLWGYEVVTAPDGIRAWEILQQDNAPQLTILDWMMPGMHGPEVCRRVRALTREPYTYMLLLTSRDDCQDIVEGLDAGADDYLTKPFHAQELRGRLRAGERILRLQQDLLSAREALRERATLDHLTRLLNRVTILEALHRELDRADREGIPVSVILVDIERFRLINDSFGHVTGDAVLHEFGRRISRCAPHGSFLGRYSGEEFLMVLPGVARTDATRLAAEVKQAIEEESFHVGAATFPVNCHVGLAERSLPYSSDPATLLRTADESLFEAKAETRERIAGALRASAASVSVTNSRLSSI